MLDKRVLEIIKEIGLEGRKKKGSSTSELSTMPNVDVFGK